MKTTQTTGLTAAVLAFASAPSVSGATLCVQPSGSGGCQTTIQAAVTLANPGDVVRVFPGVYYENVVVDYGKDGLQIVGVAKATTILDGSPYFDKGIAGGIVTLTVGSFNVRVANLTFRNGSVGISVFAGGAVLEGLSFRGTDNPIQSQAQSLDQSPSVQVLSSDFRDCFGCILLSGEVPVVRGNVITGGSSGILFLRQIGASANRAQLIGNRLEGVLSPLSARTAIETVVRSNAVRYSGGVEISGINPIVENNVFTNGSGGIFVFCDAINTDPGPYDDVPANCSRASVTGNTVRDSGDGIIASSSAPGMVVRGNAMFGGTGLAVGSGPTGVPGVDNVMAVELNRVSGAGFVGARFDPFRGDCFRMFGGGGRLVGNTAVGCADAGFYVAGFENHLEGNRALGSAENGFMLDKGFEIESFGNVLERNTARFNAAQGIAILDGVSGTTVTGNVATRNRTDFCDEGAATVAAGNTFGTTGPCSVLH